MPTCAIFDYLEGRIPNPAYAYAKIADISEVDEKEKINKEVGQRRMRLEARIDQVITDVKREVLQGSDLEGLYTHVINWTSEDDTRRKYEEKLLQHAYDTLVVLLESKKLEKLKRVRNLARDMVILKHPFPLAWKVELEWKDVNELESFDSGVLKEYIGLFPDDGLSKVLWGYLHSDISPFPQPPTQLAENQEGGDSVLPMSSEDRLLLMTEGLDESSGSILSHRLMGEYFLQLEEYDSAVNVARQAKHQIQVESKISGLGFANSTSAIDTILANALVRYQTPRHHPEARLLFESILLREPTRTPALIGIGLILEDQEDYVGAIDFLGRALVSAPDPRIKAEMAWCKALAGERDKGLFELKECLLEIQGSNARTKTLRAQTLYRIGICIWERDTSRVARKDRKGAYAQFISALQADMNYAPPYTSLGVYYADYGKDQKRARKCFQKAFELSASEVQAAKRLAGSFADSGEWGLVEVVAQRVIDSGRVKPAPSSRKKGVSWPFVALGVAQLNNQDYTNSVASFQSALRILPNDYHSWVGLGESYHNSGRYMAAIRAYEQAQNLPDSGGYDNEEDRWFCTYMLANVRRELGDFEAAAAGYRLILSTRTKEFGVFIALLQTLIECAWRNIDDGFFGRSASLAIEALDVATRISEHRNDAFNMWKAVADACSIFASVQSYAEKFPFHEVRALLESDIELRDYQLLTEFDGVNIDVLHIHSMEKDKASSVQFAIYAAILANKRSIRVVSDPHGRAIAWYNLGWTEYQAHTCDIDHKKISLKKGSLRFLKAAVQCFKRAIELEAGNSEYWNSLGIVTAYLNPKVSQHAFVRSLHLNERSARVWTNIGALYLVQNDYQLANEAFTRAQSTDPDYAHAWVGQGILAGQMGEAEEAYTLFTHAFEISASSSIAAKKQYSISAFDHLFSPLSSRSIINLLQPQFALHQLHSQQPADLPFQHLSSLFAERIGDYSSAVQTLEKICSALELEYESSESTDALARFSQAKAELSRVRLAERDFTVVVENAETSLGLSAEDGAQATFSKHKLSAHIAAGLACYYQGSMNQAIALFRSALEETQGNPDLICLLVKVLWAKGGDEERAVAYEQLLDCNKKFHGHVSATSLLGTVAVLDGNQELVKSVSVELQRLIVRESLNIQQQLQISLLLTSIATLYPEDGEESSRISSATTAVMLFPSQPHGWAQLAPLDDGIYPVEMAVLTAAKAVPPGGSLSAEGLCKAFAGTGRLSDAQRAVMTAPWMPQCWKAFS